MISREAYRGPLTKSALAMFERVDRRNGVTHDPPASVAVSTPSPPPVRRPRGAGPARRSTPTRLLAEIGMSRSRLRQWDELGLIEMRRGPGGHRVVDARVIEHLRLICALRRLGLGLRQVGWLSPEGPPTLELLQRELAALLGEREGTTRPKAAAERNVGRELGRPSDGPQLRRTDAKSWPRSEERGQSDRQEGLGVS